MGRAKATIDLPGQASTAEELWYDHRRWPTFMDGLHAVHSVTEDWPKTGSRLVWDSRPGGRGRVLEVVEAYEPRVGQTLEVEDEKIRGTQRIAFAPNADGVTVTLSLEYEIKERQGLVTPLVDRFFVRRPMTDSLRRTLSRFRREVIDDARAAL
jgi:hypothetical protein